VAQPQLTGQASAKSNVVTTPVSPGNAAGSTAIESPGLLDLQIDELELITDELYGIDELGRLWMSLSIP
jgi:hypothetical protein